MNRRQQNAALFHVLSLGLGHMEELEMEYLEPNLPSERSVGSRTWLLSNPSQESVNIFEQIEAQDAEKFQNSFRMSKETFYELLHKIEAFIQGDSTGPKAPIAPKYKLMMVTV